MQNSAEPNHEKDNAETRLAKARATYDFEYHSPTRRKNFIIVASVFGTVLVLTSAIILWTAYNSNVLSAAPQEAIQNTLFQSGPSQQRPKTEAARDGQTPFKACEIAFPPSNDAADVCVFSVYKAEKPDDDRSPDTVPGTVQVNVSHSAKPIVLVVNGYMPVNWKINLQNESVKIQKVIAVGYHQQRVEGLDASIPIEDSYYPYFNSKGGVSRKQTHVNVYTPFAFKFDTEKIEETPSFKTMLRTIPEETGMHISTFTATYTTSAFELK